MLSTNSSSKRKALPGLGSLQDHILNILDSSSLSIYWKDKKGQYLGLNSQCLKTTSFSSYNDVIGQTDRELGWSEQAPIMMENDKKVVYIENTTRTIEPAKVNNNIEHFLNYKKPLRSRTGKIIGVFGIAVLLDRENPFVHCLISKKLSKRQNECLYYLMRGKTAKETAKILNLSYRTVEHYIDSVKLQWNCSSRNELLEKAFFNFESFNPNFRLIELLLET